MKGEKVDNHNQENTNRTLLWNALLSKSCFFLAKPVQDGLEVRANKMNFTLNPKNLLVGKSDVSIRG